MPKGVYPQKNNNSWFKKGHKPVWSKKSRLKLGNTIRGRKDSLEVRKLKSESAKKIKHKPQQGFQKGHKLYTKYRETSIEIKVEQELIKRGINYQKQVPLCNIAVVDFYLPEYRIVIQCDGDYWHNLPGRQDRDRQQDAVLTFNGFNVCRFWEHEINESVEKCLNKIF